VLDLPLPLFLPPGFIFIFCSSFIGSVYWDFKLSSSIVTVLLASQVTLVFYQPSSSNTAVLLNYSGRGCLLPTQVQLQLYLLTTQPVVVFYQSSSSTTAVLLNYSGCGCLLSTEVQLKLYVLHILRLSCVLPIQDQWLINQNFIFSQYFNLSRSFSQHHLTSMVSILKPTDRALIQQHSASCIDFYLLSQLN
jgi:hypothetical protein